MRRAATMVEPKDPGAAFSSLIIARGTSFK